MGGFGGAGAVLRRFGRQIGLVACGLALANCTGDVAGKVDPKYGVAASPRVVELGKPVPKGGGAYRVGKPYKIAGRTYVPEEDPDYAAVGLASWYGDDFHGRYTANGEVFDMNSVSAAHPTMPLPSYARVTNLSNKKSVVVRVNDRGPYHGNRVIDVSQRTARLLGFHGQGLTKVKVEYVGRAPLAGSDDRKLAATLRENGPGEREPHVKVASAGDFAPAYFDPKPMTRIAPRQPPDRPYRLGEQEEAAPMRQASAEVPMFRKPPTVELAAAKRPQEPAPAATPVSAYAPVRYDGAAGYMNGRGLY
jgi:rare lipoprotein A